MDQKFCSYKFLLLCKLIFVCICEQIPLIKQKPTVNLQANPCSVPYPTTNTSAGLGNCNNDQYYIFMIFGSPPQAFFLLFDTGSPTLWLPSSNYTQYGYNPYSSFTYRPLNKNGSVQYADNSQVSGFYGTELIGLYPYINVTGQILVATQ